MRYNVLLNRSWPASLVKKNLRRRQKRQDQQNETQHQAIESSPPDYMDQEFTQYRDYAFDATTGDPLESMYAEISRPMTQAGGSSDKARGKQPVREHMTLRDESDDDVPYELPVQQPKRSISRKSSSRKSGLLAPEEYDKLFRQHQFLPTRYPHMPSLQVQYMFQKCHLGTLMNTPRRSYKEETIQFLSTLNVHLFEDEPDSEPDGGLGYITFSVHGRGYYLSTRRLEELFDFPSGTGIVQKFDKTELSSFWATIGIDQKFSILTMFCLSLIFKFCTLSLHASKA